MTSKSQPSKKVVLCILDGWGLGPDSKTNAIANAATPNIDRLIREYPNTSLHCAGESVGLPEGQFGTSEVNHLTMGSGRVVDQELTRINREISTGEFNTNKSLLKIIEHLERTRGSLHLTGIYSDGGVHSHLEHWEAICTVLTSKNYRGKIWLHVFTDGRDVPLKSAADFLERLERMITKHNQLDIALATIQGRVMLDRDRDWDRTKQAIDLLIDDRVGIKAQDWKQALGWAYNTVDTDEYLPQYTVDLQGKIKPGDTVLMTHYRTDRSYQFLQQLVSLDWEDLQVATFVNPSTELTELVTLFPKLKLEGTIAEAIAEAGNTQLHITETEKYRHVTYFFNGEREAEFPGETWELFASNRFYKPFYNFAPSMRTDLIATRMIECIEAEDSDFIVANFSSPDMVGHTGNYEAAVISAESVDFAIGKIFSSLETKLDEYALIVTADHGNSEEMWDSEANQPHTQHTFNPVPFILATQLDYQFRLKRNRGLDSIAPTILDLMQIDYPSQMTGESLLPATN